MCGRTACTLSPTDVSRRVHVRDAGTGKSRKVRVADDSSQKSSGTSVRMSFNIAPMQRTPVLVVDKASGDAVVQPMRWGMLPSWVKNPQSFKLSMFNARIEGVIEKASFRNPLARHQRCVVVAEGFYEWHTHPKTGHKQPYFIYCQSSADQISSGATEEQLAQDGDKDQADAFHPRRLMYFAGIYDTWHAQKGSKIAATASPSKQTRSPRRENSSSASATTSPKPVGRNGQEDEPSAKRVKTDDNGMTGEDGLHSETDIPTNLSKGEAEELFKAQEDSLSSAETVVSYTVVTVPAAPTLEWLHDRMPAILTSDEDVDRWLDPSVSSTEAISLLKPVDKGLGWFPVSNKVGSIRNTGPECLRRIELGPDGKEKRKEANIMEGWLKRAKGGGTGASDKAKATSAKRNDTTSSRKTISQPSMQPAVKPQQRACPACTLLNDSGRATCSLCGCEL